jgi:hypothetical protein
VALWVRAQHVYNVDVDSHLSSFSEDCHCLPSLDFALHSLALESEILIRNSGMVGVEWVCMWDDQAGLSWDQPLLQGCSMLWTPRSCGITPCGLTDCKGAQAHVCGVLGPLEAPPHCTLTAHISNWSCCWRVFVLLLHS